jgi:hypothetical protein
MCCFFTLLVFLGPRFAILFWWLVDPIRFEATFGGKWLIALLTWIFIPWTQLMYLAVAPFGAVTEGPDITGFDWVLLGLAIVCDIASYTGGGWYNRKQIAAYVPPPVEYPSTPPPASPPTSTSGPVT